MARDTTRYFGADDLDDFVDFEVKPPATIPLEQLYADAIVRVARSYVGMRERPGNRGPLPEKVLGFVGWRDPAPYCSGGVALVNHEAAESIGAVTTCPRRWQDTLSATRMFRWAMEHPELCELILDGRDLRPGDAVIMVRDQEDWIAARNGRLRKGHAYLAMSPVVGIDQRHDSVEFNTDLAGDREGDGVYAREDRRFLDPCVVGGIRFHARRQGVT